MNTTFSKPEITPARQAFYDRLAPKNVAPLWEVLARLVPAQPAPEMVPVLFEYEQIRPLLMIALADSVAGPEPRREVKAKVLARISAEGVPSGFSLRLAVDDDWAPHPVPGIRMLLDVPSANPQ